MTTDLHFPAGAANGPTRCIRGANQFEADLEQCPDCRAELGGLQATATRLAEAQSHAPPAAERLT